MLVVAIAAMTLISGWPRHAAAEESPTTGSNHRPNILLLLSDDHNYRALGFAGNRQIRTPNLDRLASEGVYFTHCFTPMPQCSPSRAALLTGQDCWTSGVRIGTDPFKKDAILWPQLLEAAGYETFYTGKWHNAGLPWDWGFTVGDNIYAGGMSSHNRMKLVPWKQPKDKRKLHHGFSSAIFADTAIRYLKERKSDRPFCAYVSFTAPHDPWTPPEKFAAMYDAATIELPPNFMPRPPFRVTDAFLKLRDQQVLPFPRTETDVRQATALYYGMVTHLDHEIGRILRTLDEQGLAENTLVIFAGDHGHSLASHGFVGKQCMYEEGIRLPLILRYPRFQRAPRPSSELVSLVDLFPTICEAASVAVPPGVEGRSLLRSNTGVPAVRRSRIFASHHSPEKHGMSTHCIRTKRFKLIEHRTTGELEMFDLKSDPFELTNLSGNPDLAEVERSLKNELDEWAWGHEAPEPISTTANE